MVHYTRSIQRWFSQTRAWLSDEGYSRGRMVIFGTTVVVYPVVMIIWNGPLLSRTFVWRRAVDYDLPDHLQTTIDKQYKKWLDHEARLEKDAHVRFSCQKDAEYLDSYAAGSMGVRFGAQIALPFFARFTDEEEALAYCRRNLEPLYYRGIPLCIIWDSAAGRELISTFVLSQKALKFLVTRDLFANNGYNAFANRPITWATWTTFASLFTYFMHNRFGKGTFRSFCFFYAVFIVVTYYASKEWHNLYRHMNNCHSDSVSAKLSTDYTEGGKEYYFQLLKRNRILRELIGKDGDKYISVVGDERDAVTPYLVRYELLKDIGIDDDEVRSSFSGDVF